MVNVTHQVLHLVVRLAILQVGEVDQSIGRSLHQASVYSVQSIVEHVTSLHIVLAGHQPRLEQVLIETVPQSSQGDVLCDWVWKVERYREVR